MSNATPFFNELTDHPFIASLLDVNMVLMKAEREGVKYYELNKQQQYDYDTGYRAGQVLNQLERIEQANILITSYPYIKAWRNHYGQFEYFQYHAEAYYLGVAGLVDRLLLLINQVCGFGLNERDVTMTSLIRQLKRTNRAKLLAAIENLKVEMQSVKKMRNDVTHAQRFHDKDLWHIALIEFSLRHRTIDDEDGFLKADLDWYIKDYRKKMSEQCSKISSTLLPLVERVFDELAKADGRN